MSVPFSWVEKLFASMSMLYGNRMEKMWNGMDKGQVMVFWHLKLEDLTQDEFTRGVKLLDRQEHPPSLPQFLKLCRPDVDPMKAYYEAVKGLQERRAGNKGEWSHPAIFWAASSMAFDLLNMSQSQVEKRWKAALDQQYQQTTWQPVPDVPVALNLTVDKAGQAKVKQKINEVLARARNDRGNTEWLTGTGERKGNLQRLVDGWKPTAAVRRLVLDAARGKGIAIPQGVCNEQ